MRQRQRENECALPDVSIRTSICGIVLEILSARFVRSSKLILTGAWLHSVAKEIRSDLLSCVNGLNGFV